MYKKLGVLLFLCGTVYGALAFLPYPELKTYKTRSYGLAVEDRNGITLRVFPAGDGVKREWVPLEEIPAGVRRVFVRAEDRRFYFHPGVDPAAVAAGALRNLRAGRTVSGASTITMQLARLIRPRGPGLGGKAREAFDALRLEARLSKKEILELWLNGIPFGSNIEGLPAMSRARFGRTAGQLDEARAAVLAVIPRRPGRYDPAVNPEAAAAAALALSGRARLGLDEAAIGEAVAEAAEKNAGRKAPFRAPHFTGRLARMIRDAEAPPPAGAPRSSRFSTLDLGLQSYAEERLTAELAALAGNRVSNGAILAVENETGAVRVYAGSASWFDEDMAGKIDGVRVFNQPGSCLKPFLYALALDRGFGPADILPDLPTVFGGGEAYMPANFNRRFNGPVRLRLALASSLNVPAVYLLERLGVRSFEEYLAGLGFDSVFQTMGSHGTGLALGNAEVSLEELVRAFSAFPRGGTLPELRWFEDSGGEAGGAGGGPERIMSPYAAWVISDILSDRASRFTGFGPAPALTASFPVMFKTGTANQFQHIWALGATRRFTVGVWMGNFSGETVVGRTGSSIPARIAADLLKALETVPETGGASPAAGGTAPSADPATQRPWGEPPGEAREVSVCALSGMAAAPACTGTLREWFREDRIPGPCVWHRPGAAEPVYPPEYRAWLAERFRRGEPENSGAGRSIRVPVPGSVFYLDPSLPEEAQALRIETAGFGSGALVYADGTLRGSLNHAGVYVLPLTRGRHRIYVEDENGAGAAVEIEVRRTGAFSPKTNRAP